MPDRDDSPLYWPIGRLTAAFAAGELSPVELIEEVIARIDRFDPLLHAYLGRLDAAARDQALAAETAYRDGEAGPLAGIPVSIKDTFPLAGAVTTFGSAIYADNLTESDSGVVRRLRVAGAVFPGKTNVAEFGQSATTDNLLGAEARNPWDTARTPGGSSGGAAASVAAGLAVAAIGADGGGSIRIPAGFTGLFGLKRRMLGSSWRCWPSATCRAPRSAEACASPGVCGRRTPRSIPGLRRQPRRRWRSWPNWAMR
jgi:Asp-tRNA(Asn)/Glu-tRNA(Gln) amidotransferase A subunit family amidase